MYVQCGIWKVSLANLRKLLHFRSNSMKIILYNHCREFWFIRLVIIDVHSQQTGISQSYPIVYITLLLHGFTICTRNFIMLSILITGLNYLQILFECDLLTVVIMMNQPIQISSKKRDFNQEIMKITGRKWISPSTFWWIL